jgi:hypothetical protein
MEKKRDLPERSFKFALAVIELCRKLDEKPGVSRTLANQLLRCGTSIGANIEEGQASQSRRISFPNIPLPVKKLAKLITGSGYYAHPAWSQ